MYLVGSAFTEFIVDVALCLMKVIKIHFQTRPGFARGLSYGLPKFIKAEGSLGLYKELVPLWGHQIPCMKYLFHSFS
ncbi:hypothetical protein KSP39_PZI012424 [Platanthera zijinensis]|uniref:Uncharacterized protein n=1 Tax=Platanthera zijinensis TaxID=2320716 RepID=A0AAP0BFP2_9ASPA